MMSRGKDVMDLPHPAQTRNLRQRYQAGKSARRNALILTFKSNE